MDWESTFVSYRGAQRSDWRSYKRMLFAAKQNWRGGLGWASGVLYVYLGEERIGVHGKCGRAGGGNHKRDSFSSAAFGAHTV